MAVIWKYPLRIGEQTVSMPDGALLLDVGEQLGRPVLWATVDPDRPMIERPLFVAFTGNHDVDERWRFIGTVTLTSGLVLHVFDPAYRMKGL